MSDFEISSVISRLASNSRRIFLPDRSSDKLQIIAGYGTHHLKGCKLEWYTKSTFKRLLREMCWCVKKSAYNIAALPSTNYCSLYQMPYHLFWSSYLTNHSSVSSLEVSIAIFPIYGYAQPEGNRLNLTPLDIIKRTLAPPTSKSVPLICSLDNIHNNT